MATHHCLWLNREIEKKSEWHYGFFICVGQKYVGSYAGD